MDSWVYTLFMILLQNTVRSIRVDDSSSKFLIVEQPPDNFQKNTQNDLHHHIFQSNRSNARIRSEPSFPISPPTIHSINSLGLGKPEEKKKKGSRLTSPSVEITPAHSQYLGYTIESHLQDSPSTSKLSKRNQLKNDQSALRSTTKKHHQSKQSSIKHTHVKVTDFPKTTPLYPPPEQESTKQKFTQVENTIHRPKTHDEWVPEKPIHEYFSSDLTDLLEKAHHLDHKTQVGSTRKLRNSDHHSLGYGSDKYEVQEYLDHHPHVESTGEYHVYDHGEKKKKKEIHYHQHKHLHDHDHDQKHSHKHQSGHHHDHGHEHRQKHSHLHGHDDEHWHEHHEKDEHHHVSHHQHDHHGSHGHKHHEDHDHKHDSGHHHGHEDHHDHHEDHKNWHSHKHHGDHDHHHGHDHRHKGKHGHEHKHGHKHNHHQKHGGKH